MLPQNILFPINVSPKMFLTTVYSPATFYKNFFPSDTALICLSLNAAVQKQTDARDPLIYGLLRFPPHAPCIFLVLDLWLSQRLSQPLLAFCIWLSKLNDICNHKWYAK